MYKEAKTAEDYKQIHDAEIERNIHMPEAIQERDTSESGAAGLIRITYRRK